MFERKRLALLKQPTIGAPIPSRVRIKRQSQHITIEPGSYDEQLSQAGITIPKQYYIPSVFFISFMVGYAASNVGSILAICSSFALAQYLLFGLLAERAAKRKSKVTPQIPTFIDGLVTALSTGFNLEAAVAQATEGLPAGLLRTEMERVVGGIQKGLSIEEAFQSVKHRIAGNEVASIAVALSLFYNMGGRMLEPFKRLSRKVREEQKVLERALRDLVQTRLAFQILFGLSVIVPAILMLVQSSYLATATSSPTGRMIIEIAMVIQVVAVLIFKRITTFRF